MKFNSFFKSANDRYLKKYQKTVNQINALEPNYEKLTDSELQAKTTEFKSRLANGETLESLLPEAFATVREASKRVLGMRPFDVQLIGGIILNNGQIAEMKTGEGKTLVATLPVYLNALTGKGVHVVTVNDYLAKRDSDWMGQIYRFLGLTVSCITHAMDSQERQDAYNCDITYATNNELGFDYLRDNMRFALKDMVQRPFNFAIVDEVDSILIDEARTPLIISGLAEDSSATYQTIDTFMKQLKPEYYEKDEKHRSVNLTEAGTNFIETELNAAGLMQGTLYDLDNIALVHHVEQALKAHTLFEKDRDYIVKNDKVIIIDEFTGRMMDGRRYSDGLHQAIEAKEHVSIQAENQTLASITFQNYFRLYPKLSGMTGTAMTEASEFDSIYHLQVIEIPTNRPLARRDENDVVYRTAAEKYNAIIEEIKSAHARRQPILVGTTSIEKSELLAKLLKEKTDIPFNVLNARNHEQEATIVAQAGVPSAVTIATNMAGRGTDIQLGGNFALRLEEEKAKNPDMDEQLLRDKVSAEIEEGKRIALEAGGLYVLGSERHESRRIDNQLRGRSGRQGDPGLSKFYVSLEDDLMRIFGSDRISAVLKSMRMAEGYAIVNPWLTKAIAKAQQKVEAFHFDVRKNLLKYDDVMNDQRKVIYEQRKELMTAESVSDVIQDMRHDCIYTLVYSLAPEKSIPSEWDMDGLTHRSAQLLGIDVPFKSWASEPGMNTQEALDRLIQKSDAAVEERMKMLQPQLRTQFEKSVLIQTIDQLWKEHLQTVDFMRTSIGLRAYGQKNPLNEYKKESFLLFEAMLSRVRERITTLICNARFEFREPAPKNVQTNEKETEKITDENLSQAAAEQQAEKREQPIKPTGKVPRNAPCPCGSGKKYKHCCGAF